MEYCILFSSQGTFLLIYVNEYNIAVQAFALQGSVADQIQWMDAIKKAQVLINNTTILVPFRLCYLVVVQSFMVI